MLLNYRVGSEEHNVYNEKCDAQQTSKDINILNVNVENVTQEENSALKSCNDVQQLPSSESFTQNVPSDMKEEEKSSVLGSLPRNHDEDVFLPITTSQVKYFFCYSSFFTSICYNQFSSFNYTSSSLTDFCINLSHMGIEDLNPCTMGCWLNFNS
jgi:hypothetical protein